MKRSNIAVFSFIVMVISLLMGHLNTEAFDACRNVTFRVKNSTGRAIDIKQVKYYNSSEARWETENVKNGSERCNNGQTCDLAREDLGGAENDRITKVKFVYKEVSSNATVETTVFQPTDPVCRAEKIFGYGQMWTITNANSTATSGGGVCENVFFKYTNGREDTIKVTDVEYFIGGKWKKEAISGNVYGEAREECRTGQTCVTYDVQSAFDNQGGGSSRVFDIDGSLNATFRALGISNPGDGSNLPNADGADITKIRFHYKYLPPGRGANWSSKIVSSIFEPTSPRCSDERLYGDGQRWTIGGGGANVAGTNGEQGGNAEPVSTPGQRGGKGTNKAAANTTMTSAGAISVPGAVNSTGSGNGGKGGKGGKGKKGKGAKKPAAQSTEPAATEQAEDTDKPKTTRKVRKKPNS